MIASQIINAVATCFYVYFLMIFVRCLLTFIPNLDWNNPPLKWLKESVDIYLDLFRKFIPPVGPFDLSPMVAFFGLMFIEWLVLNALAFILHFLGLGIAL